MRNASTVYAFDFFQTLLQPDLKSIFGKIFGNRMLFNPHRLGIRWVVIAPVPKMWYPIIKVLCILNGLNPVQIILSDKWFSSKDSYKSVLNIIMNISNNKPVLNYIKPSNVRRLKYISNNLELIKFINSNISRLNNDVLAETVTDFWSQKFDSII